ncbi:MAG: hypothetical protein OEW60_01110 [Thiovulaceae bacterium]|nr:hypothetical protein [Sulfurimonadaceae bacterium]
MKVILARKFILTLCFFSFAFGVEATFDGYMRGGYIIQNQGSTFQDDALAFGGKVGSHAEITRHMEINLGLYFSELLYATDSSAITADFVDTQSRSFAFLGEASLKGEYQYHNFDFGRQKVNTAHADGDDIRMVPNLFQAYSYVYDGFVHTKLQLVHFTHMAGWENGADTKMFTNMHDVLGITNENGTAINKGLTMVHWGYENNTFSFDFYDYHLYDAYNIVYLELGYFKEFSEAFSLGMGLQYNANFGISSHQNGGVLVNNLDAQVVGAQVTLGFGNLGVELGLSGTQGIGSDPINGSWGGGPYFTSLEAMTFDAIGDNAGISYVASLSIDLFIDGLALSYAYGDFQAEDQIILHIIEQNAALTYEKENVFTLHLGFASGIDQLDPANNYNFTYLLLQTPLVY